MKLVLAAALVIGGVIASAVPSFAMTVAPTAPGATSATVQDVRWGCRPGWHANRWGRCVPNRPRWHAPGWRGHDRHHHRRRWHH